MSALEIPASIALLLVMASLALSLNAVPRHPPVGSFHRPALVDMEAPSAVPRVVRP